MTTMFDTVTDARVEDSTDRYGEKLKDILERATHLFAQQGYHNTSIRDLSRDMDISLAGLYYYFETKEELLFLISKHSFDTVLTSLSQRLEGVDDPAERLRALVHNHLQYFVNHLDAMKVLAHESDSLSGPFFQTIRDKKRQYLDVVESVLLDLYRRRNPGARMSSSIKIAALSLFGMMNWTYTWYQPDRTDNSPAPIRRIADEMTNIFLQGLLNSNR